MQRMYRSIEETLIYIRKMIMGAFMKFILPALMISPLVLP
ncbi:putative membrane protein [Acinetobacter baumannii 1297549]|nr:putative membrane protein [Acinetobacter baumannii 1297549]